MADLPNLANIPREPASGLSVPGSRREAGMNMDCLARINRAIDHVTRNLAEPLRLDEVAKVACFSPYHFHRVFRAVVGETLHDFVKRLRLDRALYLMSHGAGMSLTEVAIGCGFGSSSDFSRSFRDRFGVPPSAFDLEEFRKMRRQQMVDALPEGEKLAYLRVFRPFEGGVVEAAAKLVDWAKARGLEGGQWLGWMWEERAGYPRVARGRLGRDLLSPVHAGARARVRGLPEGLEVAGRRPVPAAALPRAIAPHGLRERAHLGDGGDARGGRSQAVERDGRRVHAGTRDEEARHRRRPRRRGAAREPSRRLGSVGPQPRRVPEHYLLRGPGAEGCGSRPRTAPSAEGGLP